MKNLRRLVFATAFFFVGATLQAQVSTADSLAQKLFASLQAKDEKAFVSLQLNAQQLGRLIKSIMTSDMVKKAMAADEKSKDINVDSLADAQVAAITNTEKFGTIQAEFGKSFQKTIEQGEQKGVKWNEAKLTGYTIDSSTVSDKNAEAAELLGLKEAKGVIDFSVGDSAYQMAYSQLVHIKSEGGWIGGEFSRITRKGEPAQPDAVDSPPASQKEIKEPEPAKNKKPVAKAKTSASKSPARNPKS